MRRAVTIRCSFAPRACLLKRMAAWRHVAVGWSLEIACAGPFLQRGCWVRIPISKGRGMEPNPERAGPPGFLHGAQPSTGRPSLHPRPPRAAASPPPDLSRPGACDCDCDLYSSAPVASEHPSAWVRRAGRAWRLQLASVSLGPRRMEPVPAATATAAPPGCSDLRGELHALALGEEEGQGLVANLRRKRYLFYSFETLSVTCTRRSNT